MCFSYNKVKKKHLESIFLHSSATLARSVTVFRRGLKQLGVAHNPAHEPHQVKEVEDFLSLLQLIPLDDVLSAHSGIFVTGHLLVDLHELQKAAALGVKRCGVVVGQPVLWPPHTGHVVVIVLRRSRRRLSNKTATGQKSKFHSTIFTYQPLIPFRTNLKNR